MISYCVRGLLTVFFQFLAGTSFSILFSCIRPIG